jgi:hypothetical protein
VTRSNNAPETVAQFYLDCVRQNRSCLLQTRTDCGSENGVIDAAQCYFRSSDNGPLQGEQAHAYGISTHNQRIENWWSHLKKTCTSWWIQFFKDLVENKQLNLDDEFTKECLWFAFNGVLQSSLDEVQLYWNTHYIRPSRHETVAGVRDILFAIPEQFGDFDCHVQVPDAKLHEVQLQCVRRQTEDENPFQEYFSYLLEFHEMQYPSEYNEAFHMFDVLMGYA